jgi:hypothetical protein
MHEAISTPDMKAHPIALSNKTANNLRWILLEKNWEAM